MNIPLNHYKIPLNHYKIPLNYQRVIVIIYSHQYAIPNPKAMAMCIVMMKPTDPDWGQRGVTVSGALPSQLKLDERWLLSHRTWMDFGEFKHGTCLNTIKNG